MSFYLKDNDDLRPSAVIFTIVVILTILAGIILAMMFGLPAYSRAQALKNERNQTTINDIQIAQTEQLVKVQTQKAQIQIEEAKGIAESQNIIKSSLTPLYIQYLAIEAQKAQVQGQNHTIIYVPSGNNGIPLVQTTNPENE